MSQAYTSILTSGFLAILDLFKELVLTLTGLYFTRLPELESIVEMPNTRNQRDDNTPNGNRGGRGKRVIRGKGRGNGQGRPGPRKALLVDIAATTLQAVERGNFELAGETYDLKEGVEFMTLKTKYYAETSNLADWETSRPAQDVDIAEGPEGIRVATVTVSECSTLVGIQNMHAFLQSSSVENKLIGVLNFASAKNPGGGFIKGASAQEESLARSSTIYSSLLTDPAQTFYKTHRHDPKKGYYSHAMIYSPKVLFFRADNGDWKPPIAAEVITSCAVNAGVVRRYLREKNSQDETALDEAMYERMARVLYLFERHGVRNLVLGSFGTGVFRNRVGLVAKIWKKLLVGDKARFGKSFERVDIAIIDNKTYEVCKKVFDSLEDEVQVDEPEDVKGADPGDEEPAEENFEEDNGDEDGEKIKDENGSESQASDSKL